MIDFVKILLAIPVLAIIAGSLYADLRWRRWMAARRQEHEQSQSGRPGPQP